MDGEKMEQGYNFYNNDTNSIQDDYDIRNNKILTWILTALVVMMFGIVVLISTHYLVRFLGAQGTLLAFNNDERTIYAYVVFMAIMLLTISVFRVQKYGICRRPLTKKGRRKIEGAAMILFLLFLVIEAYFVFFQSYVVSFDGSNIYINNQSIKTIIPVKSINEMYVYNTKSYHEKNSKYGSGYYALGVKVDIKYQNATFEVANTGKETRYENINLLINSLAKEGAQMKFIEEGSRLPASSIQEKKIYIMETPTTLLKQVEKDSLSTKESYNFVNKQKEFYEATAKNNSDLKDSADVKVFRTNDFTIAFIRSSKDTFPIVYFKDEPYYMFVSEIDQYDNLEFLGNGKKFHIMKDVYTPLKQEALKYFNIK